MAAALQLGVNFDSAIDFIFISSILGLNHQPARFIRMFFRLLTYSYRTAKENIPRYFRNTDDATNP